MTMTAMYTQMLEDAEADLRKANMNVELREQDVQRAQTAHVAAREQQAKMQATCDWLRERLRDLPEEAATAPAPQPTPAPIAKPAAASTGTLFGRPVPEVTHAELCRNALEHLGKSARTREIREQIREFGHELDQGQVRSALKYLARRRGSGVENPEPGVWLLRPDGEAASTDATVLPLNASVHES